MGATTKGDPTHHIFCELLELPIENPKHQISADFIGDCV